MAKNRNKKKLDNQKKKDGVASMDVSKDVVVRDVPQPMDTSEGKQLNSGLGVIRKIKKGVPLKRSKNLRKQKGIARALTNNEKVEEKVSKNNKKTQRIQTAKSLYD